MAPSNVNDAIRELMAQLKDFQVGSAGDPVTVGGVLTVQAGSASTPSLTTAGDTNTGMFFPAADTIAFAEGGAEVARFDSSGNLGLGVTPSAWNTAFKAMQLGNGAVFTGQNNTLDANLSSNWYYKSGAADAYIANGFATLYQQTTGKHIWLNAPSGTAGNAITFTQAMTLDASGNLGVGTTSAGNRVSLKTTGGGCWLQTEDSTNTSGGNVNLFGSLGTGVAAVYTGGANPIAFYTNATERARIDSSGNLLIGTTSGSGNNERLNITGSVADFFIRTFNTNASPAGMTVIYSNAIPNNTGSNFIYCQDQTTLRFSVRSNGGVANYSANDVNLSDRREKTNFAPAKSYLDVICAIPVQTFNYIDQNLEEDGGLTLGVVAQDVQSVAPELVMESNWGTQEDPKMRLSIYQTDLQYALMKCIQEQQAIIESLTTRITALEGK
jgi:hypothetical protein